MLVGAIEGGGTKFICSIARFEDAQSSDAPPTSLKTIRIPTLDPEATLATVVDFFHSPETLKNRGNREALGLGMFGPVQCDTRSPRWGYILKTPKSGCIDIDVAQRFQRELSVPVGLETDVAAAAIGEWKWGAGRNTHI
jgi:fructokinase